LKTKHFLKNCPEARTLLQINERPHPRDIDTSDVFSQIQVDYMGFTLEDIGKQANFDKTLARLQ